jgi:radical SAM superfamily enzyme YgiQ (UPF0313 family)
MPYLAASVPANWDVIHVDEEAEDIDWNIDPDVVGITFHTPSAFHAYDIATRFRSRGMCVVMGGPHVTLVPEEASQYADVIFIGEAEGLWEEFLNGFEAGSYGRVYQRTSLKMFPWLASNYSTGTTIRMGFYLRPGDVPASVISAPLP